MGFENNNFKTVSFEGDASNKILDQAYKLRHDSFETVSFEGDASNKILDQAYKLRHEIFVEELKWVLVDEDDKEKDRYDANAIHFLAFRKNSEEIAGYVRIIPPENPFMLENEFRNLLSTSELKLLDSRKQKREAAEISRLALPRDLRGGSASILINLSLYKEMYHWSLKIERHSVRYLYMVATAKRLRFLQKFIPCILPIGTPKQYGKKGHEKTIAAVIDIKEMECNLKENNPDFLKWLLEGSQV